MPPRATLRSWNGSLGLNFKIAATEGGVRRKTRQCNCKNSRCLKLYCECFASGQYCEPGSCNCVNCFNNMDSEQLRAEAVEATLERNPTAFRPKVASTTPVHGASSVRHNKGCNCKKSGCLKKYCECFQAGIVCSDSCKCCDCRNYEGSAELHVVLASIRGYGGVLALPKKKSKLAAETGADTYRDAPAAVSAPAFAPRAVASVITHPRGGPVPVRAPQRAVQVPKQEAHAHAHTTGVTSAYHPHPTPPGPPLPAPAGEVTSRPGALAPELAIIPDFGAITEEAIQAECASMFRALASEDSSAMVGGMHSAEAERTVLSSLLASLRSYAAIVTAKHNV